MDLLLLGLSRFAVKRVLPAAALVPGIDGIDVATARPDALAGAPVPQLGTVHDDWRRALATTRPGLVYVSLRNRQHAEAVRRALDHGHHVVVDKPGLPDEATAEQLVATARASRLVLAEATCYPFHPLFATVRSILADHGTDVTTALAVFTPPVPRSDWRWDAAAGGGAIADTGPYAVSLGRVLWQLAPDRVEAVVDERTPESLEASYSMLARYPGGRSVVGRFGFTDPYRNTVTLLGNGISIDVERPFSAPPDLAVDIGVRTGDSATVHTVAAADSMALFLTAVVAAAAGRPDAPDLGAALVSDARALCRLRRAAAP